MGPLVTHAGQLLAGGDRRGPERLEGVCRDRRPGGVGRLVPRGDGGGARHGGQDRGFRLFLVILPGTPELSDPKLAFLRTRTWVDLRDGLSDRHGLAHLVSAITGVSSTLQSPEPGVADVPIERLARPELAQAPQPAGRPLPGQATSFVGREAELEEAARLLEETALLTVTGVGGVGKTRFAVRLAPGGLGRL